MLFVCYGGGGRGGGRRRVRSVLRHTDSGRDFTLLLNVFGSDFAHEIDDGEIEILVELLHEVREIVRRNRVDQHARFIVDDSNTVCILSRQTCKNIDGFRETR